MKKGLIILGVVIVVVGGGVSLLWAHQSKPVPVKTVSVKRRTITETVTAVGSIVPAHIITIRSALDGMVTKMYKNIGDAVKKGDSLALVGPNVAPATLAQAITNVEAQEAKVAADRVQVASDRLLIKNRLANENYSSYVTDLSTLRQDEATLKYDKQYRGLTQYGKAMIAGKLEKGQVESPIDGYILQRNVDVGDTIISVSSNQAATNLFTIADMSAMVFKGAVDELDADKLKVGIKASVEVGPLGGKKVQGKLTRLGLQSNQENKKYSSSAADENTNSPFNVGFQVEIGSLVLPKKVILRSGFSATATFVTHVYKQVLTLPQKVVHFTQQGAYVMVSQGDQKPAKKVTVKAGGSDGLYVEILSGLKEGTAVLEPTGKENAS
jgi:HlyD family secretion protein